MTGQHTTWASSERFVPRRFIQPFLRFAQIEAASGVVLLAAAAFAILWANSPWSESYTALFSDLHLDVEFGPIELNLSLGHLINDGLMAIFFFVVGLEIKREVVLGEFRDRKAATLPVMAALGGMLVPALIYVAFTSGLGPEAMRGWGIPMATDIAFVVGVMSLLGDRIPSGAKLFILALAIADDLGAILVIAIFYTDDLSVGWLGLAALGLVVVGVARRVGIRSHAVYVPVALFVWFAMLQSGVHPTLTGVFIAFLTPARALYSRTEFETKTRHILDSLPPGDELVDEERADHAARQVTEIATESIAPLNRHEHRLLLWSSFLVVPLFALANAGVSFAGTDLGDWSLNRVALGVGVGLVVGKTIGISLFTWLAVRTGLGRLPANTGWAHVFGLAMLAGIGFTVALFVTSLAFTSPELTDIAKVGIFAGSLVAGILGTMVLRKVKPLSTDAVAPAPTTSSAEGV